MRIPYLVCGLLLPFATFFNPIFVDLFLRLIDKPVLYRFAYVTPFSMAGAYLLILLLRQMGSAALTIKLRNVGVIFILIITLFPLNYRFVASNYSRVPWLGTIASDNGLKFWSDMTEYIREQLPQSVFYTDPVTGYIITAATKSYSPRYKFSRAQHQPINFSKFDETTFKQYHGGYLVINLREGGQSPPGALSCHWPVNVLKLKQYYKPELLKFIESDPPQLELIWQQNDIQIYRIH